MSGGSNTDNVEQRIRDAYQQGTLYASDRICRKFDRDATEYVDRLLHDKVALVREYYRGGTMVDLCCASGSHVVDIAEGVERAIGVDFSDRYLASASALAVSRERANVSFVQADARRLPLASGSVQSLYCFSSLYAIPGAEAVIAEVGRVLAPGGYAVLDFGNRRSLNVFCLRYYTEWPPIFPLSLGEIRRGIAAARLTIQRHRCYQLLPLWAGKPSWLWPLLHPFWKNLLKARLAGRMLDEWISSLPGVRALAFRHVIVCRKPEARH